MIYVFKTSLKSQKSLEELTPQLNQLVGPSNWHVDLEDCDRILRIISRRNVSLEMRKTLHACGYTCEELLD